MPAVVLELDHRRVEDRSDEVQLSQRGESGRVGGRSLVQELQGDDVVGHFGVDRSIDRTHATRADLLLDLVALSDDRPLGEPRNGEARCTYDLLGKRVQSKGFQQQGTELVLEIRIEPLNEALCLRKSSLEALLDLIDGEVEHEGQLLGLELPRKTQLEQLGVSLGELLPNLGEGRAVTDADASGGLAPGQARARIAAEPASLLPTNGDELSGTSVELTAHPWRSDELRGPFARDQQAELGQRVGAVDDAAEADRHVLTQRLGIGLKGASAEHVDHGVGQPHRLSDGPRRLGDSRPLSGRFSRWVHVVHPNRSTHYSIPNLPVK